ncbi:hypothetical protein GCM10023149_10350 [Mucilaginibacter gynuensis]|uniref:DUF6630 domain-containing protein n=1 Tax=Mucilaginibacter gynuensis TaxID=1302236 RepID=A0ABP8FZL6_9SPHI
MREVTKPDYHKILTPFINKLNTKDVSGGSGEPLYSIAEFADDHHIPYIMSIDWKADISTLKWRISVALKKNYNVAFQLPATTTWHNDASVSYDGVLEQYQKILKLHGFQMGFIDTESDEYMMLVFRVSHKNRVVKAVKMIGYKYYEK